MIDFVNNYSKEHYMKYIKPFEELTFHDDFMFGLIMQDIGICKEALECLLGIKIDTLSKKGFHGIL